MAQRAFAKRYSQAVFEIALDAGELDRWQSDLKKVARLLEDARLVDFLKSPKVHLDDKSRLLSDQLGEINPPVLNLVLLLITKDRLGVIGEVAEGYQRLLDSHRGIEKAVVSTAVPLDDGDKARLARQLGAMFDRKVVLETEVNPDLIGGVVARICGKLLDGSTRSKLAALKKELVDTVRR